MKTLKSIFVSLVMFQFACSSDGQSIGSSGEDLSSIENELGQDDPSEEEVPEDIEEDSPEDEIVDAPPMEPPQEDMRGTCYTIRDTATRQTTPDGFIWKPISEGDGNLVVLFPSWSSSVMATLYFNGEEIRGRYIRRTNGDRPTIRFPRPGSFYPDGLQVCDGRPDGSAPPGRVTCDKAQRPGYLVPGQRDPDTGQICGEDGRLR